MLLSLSFVLYGVRRSTSLGTRDTLGASELTRTHLSQRVDIVSALAFSPGSP